MLKTINKSEYSLFVGELVSFAPMQAFSSSGLSYDVSPLLPSGLSIDSVSGIIQGAPNKLSRNLRYTVTASDGISSAATTFTILVGKSSVSLVPMDIKSIAQSRIALQFRGR